MRLGDLTWPDVGSTRPIVAVPIGSCEQHGPHLPMHTDTRVAVALADALAATMPVGRVVVSPPLAITASGEHQGFPGTLSIGTEAMTAVLVELVRSADWADGVVFVNGHGGNATAVARAVATLSGEGRRVLAWWPHLTDGDAHAGITETSLMLALEPDAVHMRRAVAGRTDAIATIAADLRTSGVRAVSPNGVLGDPTGATVDHGRRLVDELCDQLVDAVEHWVLGTGSRP